MPVTIIESRCPQNHPCPSVKVCPTGALSQDGNKAPTVDAEKCTDCGACMDVCPMCAFKMSE